jgi:hypothetical protein
MQVEYATDLVFRSQAVLKPLYEQLSRQAILTTFLGHKITPQLAPSACHLGDGSLSGCRGPTS